MIPFYFLLSLKEALRQPSYVISSLVFPAMFFWFFGVPNATDQASATLLMGSFASFAMLGVLFFQLAVMTSQERSSAWMFYLRTMPISDSTIIIVRVLANLVLALLAALIVIFVTFATTSFSGADILWGSFFISLILGSIPFALMGLAVGFLVKGKAVLPISNLIYLPMSFAGGLWLPPNALPKVIQDISEYLPTRHYGELIWAVLFQKDIPSMALQGLSIYLVIFTFTLGIVIRRLSKD